MDKYLKLALIAVSLMIGIGVFYHYVIYLPELERQKIEKAEQERRTAEEKERQIQSNAEEKERQVQSKYKICIYGARKNYEANWAVACESIAKSQAQDLYACLSDSQIIDNPYMGKNYCKRIYRLLDPSPDCTLPKTRAESIEQIYKQEQDRCLTEARSGL